MHCKDTILRTQNNWPYSKLIPNSGKYDFIEVEELAELIASTIIQSEVAGIINCCTGKPVSLAQRVEAFIKQHQLDIQLEYGAFPDRPYDSPCVYGNVSKINKIMRR